jgi:hypothetical protein
MSGLGRELVRALAGTDVVPRLVSDHPRPEWRLGALTVVIGTQRAELRYARESVGWAKPRADDIVEAMRRALERLDARSSPPDKLLPELAAAYARVLAATGARDGERALLVELRGELAGYTRALFAWDLARLQREQRLVCGERRIDLGIATGLAAARRSRVVWIERERGSGAYYETFRLIPISEEAQRDQASTPEAAAHTARRAHQRTSPAHPRADGRER